jgi:hypothetical protein
VAHSCGSTVIISESGLSDVCTGNSLVLTLETSLICQGRGLKTSGFLCMPNISPSTVTPGGITGVTRSYFTSFCSLTCFVVGFLGGTYALGNFIGSDASALRISSCTGVDVLLSVWTSLFLMWMLLPLVVP